LGNDPELRDMPNGNKVANITIATSESWKDKNSGEKVEKTEWHRVVFFGRLAEIVGEYLKKGSKVYVEGRLQTRKWQDKEGNDRYTTETVAAAIIVAVVIGQFNLGTTVIRLNESLNNDHALILRNQANIDRFFNDLHKLQIAFAAHPSSNQ